MSTDTDSQKDETALERIDRENPGQDPNLIDPGAVARDRVAGTTSDAATRDADVNVVDVPADPPTDGNKASDGGPERYPFPPGGDIDVATVDPGNGKGEYMAPLEMGDWVVLDGSADEVPDLLDGRRAAVLEAPRDLVKWADRNKIEIKVRTRDEHNATLVIPLSAVKSVQKQGLDHTVRG